MVLNICINRANPIAGSIVYAGAGSTVYEKSKFSMSTNIIKHLDLLCLYKLYQMDRMFHEVFSPTSYRCTLVTKAQNEINDDPNKMALTTIVYP